MLPKKQITIKNNKQKSRFITLIHPEILTENIEKENNIREYLVSWLFLIGSLMFLFDGFLELIEGISIHVVIHIFASILFTIGSVLFIPKNQK